MARGVRGVIAAATLCILSATTASAQRLEAPSEPRDVDRNDWNAYYEFGVEQLRIDRVAAEEALAWASRLDPSRAEPLYASWIGFWARDPGRFAKYMGGDERVRNEPDVRHADSLRVLALRRNPFVHQGMVMLLYDMMPGYWHDDLLTRAWISYANAELPTALEQFGRAIQRDPAKYGYLRMLRASAFVNLNRSDSASAEVASLLAQMRAEDNAKLGDGYQSKELLEYAQGLLHLQARRAREARDAFGRAVTENPGFTPARAALGDMAIAAHDTAAALLEYSTAVEVDGKDVMLRLGYGSALMAAGRPADAVTQLQAAVSLDPAYAMPYYRLGRALEAVGDAGAAGVAYDRFLTHAAKADALRPDVERHLKALAASRRP